MSDTTPTTTNKDSPRPRIGSTSSIKSHTDDAEAFAAAAALSPVDYFDDDSETEIETTPRRYSVHRQDGSFDLCASMYKRRGGLGRNAENKW